MSLASRYLPSCPLSPSSHPRTLPPCSMGSCRLLTLTLAQWPLRLQPGQCLSHVPFDFQNLLIYLPEALPNWSLPLPTTPHLEEGSAPSKGLPTPVGQQPGIRLLAIADKHMSTNIAGLESGLGLGGVELRSQGFRLPAGSTALPSCHPLPHPRVNTGSGTPHRAPDPISTGLLCPPAAPLALLGTQHAGARVEELLEVGEGSWLIQA